MTQTMRERLILAGLTSAHEQGARVALGEGQSFMLPNNALVNMAKLLDAILAELREPDEAMCKAVFDKWGECEADHFTAMIDAVREWKA